MTPLDAARDLAGGPYAGWGEGERLVVNLTALARDLGQAARPTTSASLFGQMAELWEPAGTATLAELGARRAVGVLGGVEVEVVGGRVDEHDAALGADGRRIPRRGRRPRCVMPKSTTAGPDSPGAGRRGRGRRRARPTPSLVPARHSWSPS